MKRVASILCIALSVFCVSAAAQAPPKDERFQLVERELAIETDGAPAVVTGTYLLKFDTATGQAWRYERRSWSDPTKRASWFVAIPMEGNAADAREPGRFRLTERFTVVRDAWDF